MKRINLLFLCLIFLSKFISGYVAPVWNFPSQTWQPTLQLKEEKHITVIIPSYKNADWYEYNLASVFAQKYSNYRVIYIDDCSPDGTADLVQKYIIAHNQQARFKLISNPKRMGALGNIYRAVHAADPQTIIVTLDGDDWLAHYHVFSMLNEAYEDKNVWLTYGQFAIFPQYLVGFCRELPQKVIDQNAYRHYLWSTSHLRTFYAWLFQEIKLEDLMSNGVFYPMAWDLAFMYPMLEMSRGRFKFLPHVNYLYNIATPINDHKVNVSLQTQLGYEVGRKQKYSEIPCPDLARSKNDMASLIIFSYNRPMQLYALLESIQKYMKGLDSIAVLYRADGDRFAAAYEKVKSSFATLAHTMSWKRQQNPPDDFKPLLLSLLDNLSSDYLLFAVDDNIVKDTVDLDVCMRSMQRTKAYAFFLRLGEHITHCYSENSQNPVPNHIELDHEICAWQFGYGVYDWAYPHNVDMTLYRRANILPVLKYLSYNNPNTLEHRWASCGYEKNKAGLFFKNSKVVNVPMNVVNSSWQNRYMNSYTVLALLENFELGQKLDITKLHRIKNSSAHIEHEFGFLDN